MAEITIAINTENKTVDVSIDGSSIPDVEDASVYSYTDSNGTVTSLGVSVYTRTKSENGVQKRVSYYAEGSKQAERAIASGLTVYNDVKGFVGIEDQTQAAQDIDEFLSSQKRRG